MKVSYLLVVVSLCGCPASPTGPAGAPPQFAVVRPSPADGTTNPEGQGMFVGVSVDYQSLSLFSQADLNTVASNISLVSWPQLSPIGTAAPIIDAGFVSSQTATVVLVPSAPLSPGWYALELGAVPAKLRYASTPLAQPRTDAGNIVSLFHAGSAPLLRLLTFAAPKPGSFGFTLIFSEPVRLPTGNAGIVISQGSANLPCWVGAPPGWDAGWTTIDSQWQGGCSAGDAHSSMTITVESGFSSPSDAGSIGLPYTSTLTPSNLTGCGDGCWYENVFALHGPP